MHIHCTKVTGGALEFESKDGDWKFDVRRDGCVHIKRFSNGSRLDALDNPDMDYLHVCDLGDFIRTLTQLAAATEEYRE